MLVDASQSICIIMLPSTTRQRRLAKHRRVALPAEHLTASSVPPVTACDVAAMLNKCKVEVVRSEPVRFALQGVKDKEVIAGELASAEASLSGTPRGAALMRK